MEQAVDRARVDAGRPSGTVDVFAAMRRHARTNPPPKSTVDDVVLHFDHVRELGRSRHVPQSLMVIRVSRMLNGSANRMPGLAGAAYRGAIMRSVFVLIDRRGEA